MQSYGEKSVVKTKAIILPAIFILIIAPFMLFAKQQETIISADQISIQPDNILQAKGNVVVKRGDISIRAEAMTVNEKLNQLSWFPCHCREFSFFLTRCYTGHCQLQHVKGLN